MADRFIKVLLVEDNLDDARLIEDMLATAKGARFHLESVDGLARGIECLGAAGIDAVLLDLSLPSSDGVDTFLRVQSRAPSGGGGARLQQYPHRDSDLRIPRKKIPQETVMVN